MNGKVKSVIENHKPETYKNVKVFAAGKYVPPSNAWIRNLQVLTSASNMAMTTLPSLTADIVQEITTLKNTDTEKGEIFIIYF